MTIVSKKRISKCSLFQINNFKLYCLFLISSLIIIIISNIWNHETLKIIANIGYSVFAATVMAFFIDYNNLINLNKEKDNFRARYFSIINNRLSNIIGHLLWFEEKLNENYLEAEKEPEFFLNVGFAVYVSNHYKPYEISFEEAITRLNDIGDKYSHDEINNYPEIERTKIIKMFQISALELNRLEHELNKLDNNKIMLDIKGYADMDKTDALLRNINLSRVIMLKTGKNYKVATNLLTKSARSIRKIGNFDNNIEISINQGTMDLKDL